MSLILVLLLAMSGMINRMMFERMTLVLDHFVVVGLVVCGDMGGVRFINGYTVLLESLPSSITLYPEEGGRRKGSSQR